uniref:Ammonium transporter AmtB-like domain-containing protein n=1 Tax=Denticeps clupeoides TaxID=299321 RepID=A0AAY4DIE3_9TELE
MAPRYAPNLRSRLPVVALLLEACFILLFAFFVDISEGIEDFPHIYAVFQDVHVMVFLGFGFMATFLVRYGFSSSGFSLLVAAMTVQWAILMHGFLLVPRGREMIAVNMQSLVFAEMYAASSLIAMGTMLGKINPVHLLIMALLEVTGFIVNQWLLQTLLRVQPLQSMMLLHIFGAFFGVMVSCVLYRKGIEPVHEKEKLHSKSGLFSMLGTLFLWIFWPSFNSAYLFSLHKINAQFKTVCSTYLSLAVSCVTATSISVLCSSKGKINLAHVQNCMLAGGVTVAVAISVIDQPWVAMTTGLSAALISTLSFRFIKRHMQMAFDCHDTCGVLSVHGIPGILGWCIHLIIQLTISDDFTVAVRFAVYHITILLTTVAMSLAMGTITGILLKWKIWRPPQNRKCFDDQAYWEVSSQLFCT